MRRLCLISMTLAALGAGGPAHAQQPLTPVARVNGGPGPDAVVARLMTFDRNHDGLISRAELPERMQALLARGDVLSRDASLDAAEIRRLALAPAPATQINGLQIGLYGFGDGVNFDSRLHIDGALDDLRLAGDVREKAGAIARKIQSTSAERARTHLLATMEQILTPEQFADFKASLDGQFVTVHAIVRGGTLVFGATPQEAAGQQPIEVMLRQNARADLSGMIAKYELTVAAQQKAAQEIAQFDIQRSGRLSAIDSQAIVGALTGLLDDQQRADLRAALDRRPIVKQATGTAAAFLIERARSLQAEPGTTSGIQDLVLRLQR